MILSSSIGSRAALLVGALLALVQTVPGAAHRPHVVMIMADDWGWSEIAAYRRYQGLDEPIPTPNLDRLVETGMMFTDAHAPASLCAPTRFSMMTGSYPYRNGVQWGTWGFEAESAFSVNRRHTTVGEVMQAAGYRTAFFGKMHFGGGVEDFDQPMPAFPTTYGFDYTFCTHGGIQDDPYLYFENDRFVKIDPADPLNPSTTGTNAEVAGWPSGSYPGSNGTGVIQNPPHDGIGDPLWNSSQNGIINSRKAAAFIGDHLANHPDEPFMLYYCTPQVHVPHTPPIDFEPDALGNPHDPPKVPVAGFTGGDVLADMVYELDLQVGWILARLEESDGDGDPADSILADTLVMFTSDNGGLRSERGIPGYDSTGVLSGFKSMIEEGGHRVPFVARWGDGTPAGSHIAPGSVSDQLICGHDWVGTMYALTGQPMAPDQALDCVNLLPILLGEWAEDHPVRPFIFHQSQNETKKPWPYAVREGTHVLFLDGNRDPGPLFDLSTDLGQTHDLLADNPSAELLARRDSMRALYLAHNDPGDPRTTPVLDVFAGWTLHADDFESAVFAGNLVAAPYPTGQWHLQDAIGSGPHWTRDDSADGNSVLLADLNGDGDQELRLGWGFDEVVVLFSTPLAIDTGRDYRLAGRWEIANVLDRHLGFIAGLAEFSSTDGTLVQRLTPDTEVFGPLEASTVGEMGSFQVELSSTVLLEAGVVAGNRLGLFFHHDDDGTFYADAAGGSGNRNDVYLLDDIELSVAGFSPFAQWASLYGVAGPLADPDGDGLMNLVEFAFGGDPVSARSRGHRPRVLPTPAGLELTVPRRREAGLRYTVESSADLRPEAWTPQTDPFTTGAVPFDADFEAVTVPPISGGPPRFLRVTIEEE